MWRPFAHLVISCAKRKMLDPTNLKLVNPFSSDASNKVYIVFLGEKKHNDPELVTASHHEMLTPLFGSKEEAVNSIVCSYNLSFSGFAARLNKSQAKILADRQDVINVRPDRKFALHTTHSWDFLNVDYNTQSHTLLQKENFGEDMIIGIFDTGIWPESKSFDDSEYGPPPTKWKDTCQTGDSFCNNKIIGAFVYPHGFTPYELKDEYMSPRDKNGHGTHCASIAAGNLVSNTSFFGLAAGSVRGGAPHARLAIYKVARDKLGCNARGLVAALDAAIDHGVDVISISLGSFSEIPELLFCISKGIPVVCATGNSWPMCQSVQNNMPWIMSVAACTINRSFQTTITLGNNQKLLGQSIGATQLSDINTKLVHGWSCNSVKKLAELNVTGKIVLCYNPVEPTQVCFMKAAQRVKKAGGIGIIYVENTDTRLPELNFPYAIIDLETAYKIYTYIYSTSKPQVKLSRPYTTIGKHVVAPRVAEFSSRGPNPIIPGILKPDIVAPGVLILAATGGGYKFDSGTSMSCPHVAAIVTLLKVIHPDWSPAAIKSAIMTTASVTDTFGIPIEAEGNANKIADPFDYGAGLIVPNKAVNPGLVFDIDPSEYLKHFKWVPGPFQDTPLTVPVGSQQCQLNLPSIVIADLKDVALVTRTVTNVGPTDSTYEVIVEHPAGVQVIVEPTVISFDRNSNVQTFKVIFVAIHNVEGDYTFGSLTWRDKLNHSVRIPLAIRRIMKDSHA